MIRQKPQGGSAPEGREKVAGGGPSAARETPGTHRQTPVRPGGAREGAASPVATTAKRASPAPPGRRDGVGPESRWLRSCLAPPPANLSGPSGAGSWRELRESVKPLENRIARIPENGAGAPRSPLRWGLPTGRPQTGIVPPTYRGRVDPAVLYQAQGDAPASTRRTWTNSPAIGLPSRPGGVLQKSMSCSPCGTPPCKGPKARSIPNRGIAPVIGRPSRERAEGPPYQADQRGILNAPGLWSRPPMKFHFPSS